MNRSGIRTLIEERLLGERAIDSDDISLLHFTDSPEEAIRCIASCGSRKFGLKFSLDLENCRLCNHAGEH